MSHIFDVDAQSVFEAATFLSDAPNVGSMFQEVWIDPQDHGVCIVGTNKHFLYVQYDPLGHANHPMTLRIDPSTREMLTVLPEDGEGGRLTCDGSNSVLFTVRDARQANFTGDRLFGTLHNKFMIPNWRNIVPDDSELMEGWPWRCDAFMLGVVSRLSISRQDAKVEIWHVESGKAVMLFPTHRTVLVVFMPTGDDFDPVDMPAWLDRKYDPSEDL